VRNHLARFLKPFLLSVIFGVLIGFARYELPIYSRAENRPGITASEFVNLVRTDPSRAILQGMTASKFASLLRPHGADAVRDLTIYPTLDGKNYVRGTIVISANNLQPFQFNANNPFEFGSTIPGHDIRDFLAKECPKLSYRYAWWDSTTRRLCGGFPVRQRRGKRCPNFSTCRLQSACRCSQPPCPRCRSIQDRSPQRHDRAIPWHNRRANPQLAHRQTSRGARSLPLTRPRYLRAARAKNRSKRIPRPILPRFPRPRSQQALTALEPNAHPAVRHSLRTEANRPARMAMPSRSL